MTVGNVASYPKAEAIALLLIACQAEMRFEHVLKTLLGNARAFVIDMQHERMSIVLDLQVRAVTVFECVIDQVADAALERQRFA